MPTDPRTPKGKPPNPAVPSSDFSAAMNNIFVALVDLDRRVTSLDASRTVITPNSITSTQIAAGSIHAAQIEVGNVVASIMTVGAVNAGHIDAVSIRASILNATSIITDNLQAQVLTALQAAITDLSSVSSNTGTLTAQMIRTNVSPNARVEIGATAGGIKGYNSSNIMTFGFDLTTGAATVGAITVTGAGGTQVPASTLTGFVGGGNLLVDSSFESTDPALPGGLWAATGAGIAKSSTQSFHGTKALQVTNVGASNVGEVDSRVDTSHGVPLGSLKGRPLVYSAWVYVTGTDNSTPTNDRVITLADNVGVLASATVSTIPKNTWTRVVVKGTPSASATAVYVSVYNTYTSGSNTIYYDGLQLEFGDAATAYNPKADEILYGQINTVNLAAGAVTASTLAVGAVTATSISLGSPTAAALRNGNFTENNPTVGTSLAANGWSTFVGLGSPTFTYQTDTAYTRIGRINHAATAKGIVYQLVSLPVGRHIYRGWVKTTSSSGAAAEGATLYVEFNGTGAGTITSISPATPVTGTSAWTLCEVQINVTTAGTVQFDATFGYNISGTSLGGSGTTGTADFANLHVIPAVSGTTLTPTAIDTMTVTGATIRTSSGTARVQMDSTGLNAWNASAVNTFNISSAGAVSVVGSIYAKTGLTMDGGTFGSLTTSNKIIMYQPSTTTAMASIVSYYQSAGPNAWTDITTGFSGSGYVNVRSQLNSIASDGSTVTLSAFAFTGGGRIDASAPGGFTSTIIDNNGRSSFAQYASGTTRMLISARGSAAYSVGASATQSITITGNLPGGTLSTSFPLVALVGTNAQQLSWGWGSLGTTVDIFNRTAGTLTGTVYWTWITTA